MAAKFVSLDAGDLAVMPAPAAATPARTPQAAPAAQVERSRVDHVPFQVRIPPALAKRIKREAVEQDLSNSELVVRAVTAWLDAQTRAT